MSQIPDHRPEWAQTVSETIEEGRETVYQSMPSWLQSALGFVAPEVPEDGPVAGVAVPGVGAGSLGKKLLGRLTARNASRAVARNPQAARHGLGAARSQSGLGASSRTQTIPQQRGPGVHRARVRMRERTRRPQQTDAQTAAVASRQAEQAGRETAKSLPKHLKAMYKWLRQKPLKRGGVATVGSMYAADKLGIFDFLSGFSEDEAEVASQELIEQLEVEIESDEVDELVPDIEELFDSAAEELYDVSGYSDLDSDNQRDAVKERAENYINQMARFGEDVGDMPTDQFRSHAQKATAMQAQLVARKSGLAQPQTQTQDSTRPGTLQEQLSQVNEEKTGAFQGQTPENQDPEQRARNQATIGQILDNPGQFNRELGQVQMEEWLESGQFGQQTAMEPNLGILIDNFPDNRQPWEKKGRRLIKNPERAYQETIFKLNNRELQDLQEDLFATGFYDPDTKLEDIRWGKVDPQTTNAFTSFLSHAQYFVDENGEKIYWRTILDDLVDSSTSFDEIESQDPYADATPSRVTLRDPAALAQMIDNTFKNLVGSSAPADTQRAFVALMREQEIQQVREQAQARARAQAGEEFDFVSNLNPQAQAQEYVREEHGEEVAAQQFAEQTEVLDTMIRGR